MLAPTPTDAYAQRTQGLPAMAITLHLLSCYRARSALTNTPCKKNSAPPTVKHAVFATEGIILQLNVVAANRILSKMIAPTQTMKLFYLLRPNTLTVASLQSL